MNRDQLAQAIRTACAHLEEPHVVIFGSQAILGTFDESQLPEAASRSREVDMMPWRYFSGILTDEELEHQLYALETHVGEYSPFHDLHGVYVEAVNRETVVLPHGWDGRLVRFTVRNSNTGFEHWGLCLDPVDLCIAKGIAGREKDREFVGALIDSGLVHAGAIIDRVDTDGIDWPNAYVDDRDLALSRMLNWLKLF